MLLYINFAICFLVLVLGFSFDLRKLDVFVRIVFLFEGRENYKFCLVLFKMGKNIGIICLGQGIRILKRNFIQYLFIFFVNIDCIVTFIIFLSFNKNDKSGEEFVK